MGIQALPQKTVRALGATQVLTDPASVVKELIDNALDANATSTAIEISSNTIDVIQVRDNGHGIAPEDRPLVAKRYCTSKISHDSDLEDIGGLSLGFRGEALASATELSGSLTITTRIEGEQVAMALKINQQGEIIGQDKVSLPVGTTVRITDFIKANPVRRQVVLKNSETCLKKIKRTLQAYAFARPNVRFSVRVLKAKNNKSDWIYAPKPNGNAEDAALKIVGSACTSQCTWSVMEEAGFMFQAFLPRPDADASNIANIGSYVSVDRRPVSSSRGVFKQMCNLYREALRGSKTALKEVKDPFLYLELSCPRGSYDANLEPAKDDLLFEDSLVVVDLVKKVFNAVYAQEQTEDFRAEQAVQDPPTQQGQHDNIDDFTTSLEQLANTRSGPNNSEKHGSEHVGLLTPATPMVEDEAQAEQGDLPRQRTFRSTMYGCDEEDLDMLDVRPPTGRTEADMEDLRQANKDVSVSNPWVLAKFNVTSKRSALAGDELQSRQQEDHFALPANVLSSPLKHRHRRNVEEALPTPRPSSPSPPIEGFHPSDHVPDIRIARDGRLLRSPELPQPQQYSPVRPIARRKDVGMPSPESRPRPPEYNYATMANMGTPLDPIPDITRSQRSPRKQAQQLSVNKPFVNLVMNQPARETVWFDHLQNIERPRRTKRRPEQQGSDGLVVQGELGDFAEIPRPLTPPRRNRDIRDFVGRGHEGSVASIIEERNYGRRAAVADAQENRVIDREGEEDGHLAVPKRHGFRPAIELVGLEEPEEAIEKPQNRGAKRRKTSERRALRELSTNAPAAEPKPELPGEEEYRPETNRRPLSRRKSFAKLARTKSSKLPLECVPPGQGVHDAVFNMPVDIRSIAQFTGKIDENASLYDYNEPALPAARGLDAASSHLLSLTASLHQLLIQAGAEIDPPGPETLFGELKAAFSRREQPEDDGGDEAEIMSVL